MCYTLSPHGWDSPLTEIVQLAYVELDEGTFEPRRVEIGDRFGDRVQALEGLTEGEKVVASGTFLVDSKSRMGPLDGSREAVPVHRSEDPECRTEQGFGECSPGFEGK
jgi:hypothetical protein